MKSRGTLAGSIVLLSVLAAGSYWLAEQARHSDATARPAGHDIDYTANNITLTRMDETGRAQYVIDADALVHYADDDSGEFTQPRVLGTRTDRPVMHVRADRGTTTSDGEEVRLYGNVVLNRAAWKGAAPLVAKGPYALLYPEQEIMRSDQPVDVVQGGSRVQANAMDYDNGLHKLHLDGGTGGRVRAVIEPAMPARPKERQRDETSLQPASAALVRRSSARVLGRLVVGVTFLAFGAQAFAERADKEKPAVISADKSSGDDLNQTQIYTGDVVLTKGTIILRADQLTTRQDPEGYNYGTALATQAGKLAYFKQKREGVDEFIEGQAERIEYDEKSDTVKLFNRAIVKRLVAGRDADEIRGDRIDYNSRTEVYNAQSNNALAAGSPDTRVRVVLQPKIKPGSTEPAPNRTPSSPPIELKKESTLDTKTAPVMETADLDRPDTASIATAAGTANSVLEAAHLKKSYGKRTVVHDVSLQVKSGEVVGLLGPNGAGKTTCFYMMLGLVGADAGEITLDGLPLTHLPIHRRARLGLSYLPQEASVFRQLDVEDNVRAVLQLQRDDEGRALPNAEIERRLEALLEDLQITHLRTNSATSLSGGERRRVEIARALATSPRFILLDEPFAGIDPIAVIEIQRIVRFLKSRDIGVLITDHNVRETLGICDHAYIINTGAVLASGRPEEIVGNESVRRVYLGEHFRM